MTRNSCESSGRLARGLSLDALKRGEIADNAGGEADRIDMPIFVAVRILLIGDMLAIIQPAIALDATFFVMSEHLIILPTKRTDPELKDVVFIRSEIGELFAVR